MRIAFLSHRIPYPPNKGEKIRAFHQLRAMASRHEVDLFTLCDDNSDLDGLDALSQYCGRLEIVQLNQWAAKLRSFPYLLSGVPLTIPYFYSAALEQKFNAALRGAGYDRIFVYCSAMWQYVSGVRHIPVITDMVDVDSDKWRQYAARAPFPMSAIYSREGRYLRTFEHRVCLNSTAVVVTTEREGTLAREICPEANVHSISNGVDTGYFRPRYPQVSPHPMIVFTGDMSYFPNEEAVTFFVKEVLPVIREFVPEARFLIVGRNPGPRVQQLRRAPGVEVTGFVPDVREYLHGARVAVAPFRIAAGIQNKILEAMACALPVVATPRATQGLVKDVAAIVETVSTAEDFASRIIELLLKPDLARAKGDEGRRRVVEHYNWDRSLADLLELVENPRRTGVLAAASGDL